MHTPGHTPESISFILTDQGGGADQPMGVFTGDFIFVGSIGRPDLLEEAAGQMGTAEPGARDLYRSIQKFLQLPDYLQIWPSHGAGSACGKGLGAIPSSTLGYEKLFNEALQFNTEDEFVEYVLSDQPEAPPYFAVMKHVNKHGPKVVGGEDLPNQLDVAQLADVIESHQVIDVRSWKPFAERHVKGSINIPAKYLARDGGWFIDYESPLYLIADAGTLAESMRTLREIGVDNVQGYFDVAEVLNAGMATQQYAYQSPEVLRSQIENNELLLVDVRRQAEWNDGHIPQANYSFLGNLMNHAEHLPSDKTILFQCRTGARSAVACSIAQAAGIEGVINMEGGIVEWMQLGFPVVTEEPQTVE